MPPHFEHPSEQPSFRTVLDRYDSESDTEQSLMLLGALKEHLEKTFTDSVTLDLARSIIMPLLEMPPAQRRTFVTESYIQNLGPAPVTEEAAARIPESAIDTIRVFLRREILAPVEATGPVPVPEAAGGDDLPEQTWSEAA